MEFCKALRQNVQIQNELDLSHVHHSYFSEKGDQRMSRSQFLYVTICSSLRSIIALHLRMFFHIFLFVQL